MEIAGLAIEVTALIAVCAIGPGLLIVAKLRWSPLEKLCGAFLASFVCVYLASFALFLLNAGTWAFVATTIAFGAMGIAGWRTARLVFRRHSSRRAIYAWAVVLAWDLLHLAMIRHYGGGGWAGDWNEHFQRTQYFLHQLPNDFLFIGNQRLPARPPMMQLIAAFICRQTDLRFESFSLIFLFLNAWAFLPCALFLGLARRRGARCVPILAALFMLNPSIVENATLTATKAMAAGLVVLGIYFYLRRRTTPAAVSLAAGVLVHYSAIPFAIAVGLHWLFTLFTRRRSANEIAVPLVAAAALLATWFVWSFAVFGRTIALSSSVLTTGITAFSPETNLRRMIYNLFTSIVPHPLHPLSDDSYAHFGNLGELNDYYFTMTQETLPMMAGITGGAVSLCLAARLLFSGNGLPSPNRRFWIFYLSFTFIVGICVNAGWNQYGCAHITMQSASIMLVTLLAANLTSLPRWATCLVIAGAAADYALGILLQFDRQSYVYPTLHDATGRLIMLPDYTLGRFGAADFLAKLDAGYVFWGDHFPTAIPSLEIASVIAACGTLWFLWRSIQQKKNKTP